MKEEIKVRWFIHVTMIATSAIIGILLYYYFFHSGQTKTINVDEFLFYIHKGTTMLIILIICHFIWLLVLLIKLLIHRQFIPTIFILLFGIADIGLIKIMGFLWAATIMG
jgi:hypothetical protein